LANSVKRWNQWRRSNFRRRQLHGLAEELKVKYVPQIKVSSAQEESSYETSLDASIRRQFFSLQLFKISSAGQDRIADYLFRP
jgi:hypothetical protein